MISVLAKTDRLVRLGSVCSLISGQHIEAAKYNSSGRGTPYLTGPSDFGEKYPLVSKWTEHPKVLAKPGDILITVKGSGVGKINLLSDESSVAISRQLMAVRVSRANRDYVYAFLQTAFEHFQSQSTGAAIPGISRTQVLDLELPLPSLSEQERIVAILDEAFADIAKAKANVEKNLENARDLFDSALTTEFVSREGWASSPLGDNVRFIDYRGKTPKKVESGLRLITAKNVKMGYLSPDPAEYVEPETYDSWMTRGIPNYGDVLFTTEAPLGRVAQLDTHEKVVFAQ